MAATSAPLRAAGRLALLVPGRHGLGARHRQRRGEARPRSGAAVHRCPRGPRLQRAALDAAERSRLGQPRRPAVCTTSPRRSSIRATGRRSICGWPTPTARGIVCGLALAWGDKRKHEPFAWRQVPDVEAREALCPLHRRALQRLRRLFPRLRRVARRGAHARRRDRRRPSGRSSSRSATRWPRPIRTGG